MCCTETCLARVIFYFIRFFLVMRCPTNFAARISKILACNWNLACTLKVLIRKKRKDTAGSGDTASMIKGGGYLGACKANN